MKNKNKEENNLVWIDKPVVDEKGDSNAFEIGIKTWSMYNEDFNLTMRELCKILKCERHWVLNNVKDNVKHIFLNNNFRLFLNKLDRQNNINTFDPGTFIKDYYYFSRKDFYRWIKENTLITRQTIQIDIEEFAADQKKFKKSIDDYYSKEKELMEKGNCEKELFDLKNLFYMERYSLMNKGGKELLENIAILTKRNASAVDITEQEVLPKDFITIKELQGDKSLELVYRSLYHYGALKYTIANSLVRYDVNYIEKGFRGNGQIVTVPYQLYLEMKH